MTGSSSLRGKGDFVTGPKGGQSCEKRVLKSGIGASRNGIGTDVNRTGANRNGTEAYGNETGPNRNGTGANGNGTMCRCVMEIIVLYLLVLHVAAIKVP